MELQSEVVSLNVIATCLTCGQDMLDFIQAFKFGCAKCGGRKFSTESQSARNETMTQLVKKINIANEVAVRVSGKGSYNINLEQLMKRKPNEPIAFQDPTGTIRLVLNPDMNHTNNEQQS